MKDWGAVGVQTWQPDGKSGWQLASNFSIYITIIALNELIIMRLIKVKLHLYKTKLMNGNFWSRVQALGPGEKKNECGVTKLAEERSSRCGVRVDFNSFPSQILHGFNQLHLLQSLAPVTKNDPERKLLKSLSKFPPFQKSSKARSTK